MGNFAQSMVNPRLDEDWQSGLKEFKEFALKGSVLDMAIGIILGVASARSSAHS